MIITFSEYAAKWCGVRTGSTSHHKIIDLYNTIKPLPRGYRVTYNDSWCAAFASVVMHECKAVNAPYECSVYYMKEHARKNKQIVKTPRVNDLICYNWNGDNVPDHIGIIYGITGNNLTVIEGNYNRQVNIRNISKNDRNIDCYIRVKQIVDDTDLERVARDVIAGRWGDGADRKNRLTAAGYDYKKVQELVNYMMNS